MPADPTFPGCIPEAGTEEFQHYVEEMRQHYADALRSVEEATIRYFYTPTESEHEIRCAAQDVVEEYLPFPNPCPGFLGTEENYNQILIWHQEVQKVYNEYIEMVEEADAYRTTTSDNVSTDNQE